MKQHTFRAKLLSLVMSVAVLFAVASCGGTPTAAPTQPAPAAPATSAPAAAAPTIAPTAVPPTAAPAAAEEVFKLGVEGPFSGPSARYGEEFKDAYTMAMDEIGSKIGNYKIQPVFIDDQSDPSKGTQAYEQAIADGIEAGILDWHSSVAVALMEVVAKHKIPHLFGFGTSSVINETFKSDPTKYGYWTTKFWPQPKSLTAYYVEALEAAIKSGDWKPADRTMVLFAEDTDFGRSFAAAQKELFGAKGWKILDEEYTPLDQTEFYPLLTKVKDLNPALIEVAITAAPSVSAMVKQIDEVGLKSLVIADCLSCIGEWYQLTGKASNFVLDQVPTWASDKGKAFAANYKARFNTDPSPAAGGLAYDATRFFIAIAKEVIKTDGKLTSEGIYTFVQQKVWTGQFTFKDGVVNAEYKYTPDTLPDPVVGPGEFFFPIVQFKDGQPKIIYPPDWAEQKLQIKP